VSLSFFKLDEVNSLRILMFKGGRRENSDEVMPKKQKKKTLYHSTQIGIIEIIKIIGAYLKKSSNCLLRISIAPLCTRNYM